jgi:hypothetical protein
VIAEILCVTLPAAASYAYNTWQTTRERREQSRAYRDATRAKNLTEQQNASLIANFEENERLKQRLVVLENLVQEQQLSINRMADRF